MKLTLLQAAHQSGEDEMSLSTMGRTYTVDFHSMQQINEDSGTARPVQRRVTPPHPPTSPSTPSADLATNNNTTYYPLVYTLQTLYSWYCLEIQDMFFFLWEKYWLHI